MNFCQLTSFCEIETSGYSSMFVFGNARINTINVLRRKQRNVDLKMILKSKNLKEITSRKIVRTLQLKSFTLRTLVIVSALPSRDVTMFTVSSLFTFTPFFSQLMVGRGRAREVHVTCRDWPSHPNTCDVDKLMLGGSEVGKIFDNKTRWEARYI